MQKILIFIKQKCSECFRESLREESDGFTEWLVESQLHEMHNITQNSGDCSNSPHRKSGVQIPMQSSHSDPSALFVVPVATQSSLHRIVKKHSRSSGLRDELFYSIESKEAEQPQTSLLKKLPETCSMSSAESAEEESSYNNEGCRVQTESERLAVWMRKEYEGKTRHFQVRSAVRLRAQGRGFAGLLQHKLEDFKVSFLGESGSPFLSLANSSKSLVAHFQMDMVGSSSRRLSQVLAYYRVECSTLALSDLLRLFKSRELLRALHGFSEVGLCQLEGWNGLELPQMAVRQGKRQLHIAWQMRETQFAGEEGSEQVLEVGFSMDEGEGGWQRLVKYHLSKKGFIEVYAESFEEAGLLEAGSLRSRFTAFERLLLKGKVIAK